MQGKPDVIVVGVLKGSVIFLADLVRHIALPLHVEFIGISSYGDATVSSGVVQITQDVSRPMEDKHVIVVEDIVDTGHTVHYLLENLATRRPASIRLASLLHKPERPGARGRRSTTSGSRSPTSSSSATASTSRSSIRNLPFIGYVTGSG